MASFSPCVRQTTQVAIFPSWPSAWVSSQCSRGLAGALTISLLTTTGTSIEPGVCHSKKMRTRHVFSGTLSLRLGIRFPPSTVLFSVRVRRLMRIEEKIDSQLLLPFPTNQVRLHSLMGPSEKLTRPLNLLPLGYNRPRSRT